jgi:hypothetical protein
MREEERNASEAAMRPEFKELWRDEDVESGLRSSKADGRPLQAAAQIRRRPSGPAATRLVRLTHWH